MDKMEQSVFDTIIILVAIVQVVTLVVFFRMAANVAKLAKGRS